MNTSFFHMTSNLGSLFEDQVIEERWYTELQKVIIQYSPNVVAIHCQEMGGKEFESNMSKVDRFIKRLKELDCFKEYNRCRVYVDTGFIDINSFTALGNFYFIHKSVQSVSLWNFKTHTFDEVTGELILTETRGGLGSTLSSDEFHFKDRYPNNYFPTVRWTRKGLLHTKWKINSLIVNMVNIHMFHDEDNLVALEQSPSVYSQYRQKALHHTLEHLSKTSHDPSIPESSYIFGDFNFRLDLSSVVKHLASSHHPQFIRGEDGGLQKVFYRNSISSNEDDNLCIERKKFFLNSHSQLFKKNYQQLLKFDNESKSYQDLHEMSIHFPPSYPFSEDISKGYEYMEKRCPAWCDRVLMNKNGIDTVQKSFLPPVYNMASVDLCVGDHKPVFLFYSVNTVLVDEQTKQQQQQSTNDIQHTQDE